jgi:hypothetical protein
MLQAKNSGPNGLKDRPKPLNERTMTLDCYDEKLFGLARASAVTAVR